jgi:regulator of RNase E activity RraA
MTANRHRDYHALLTIAAFVACCGATRIVGAQGPAAAVPSARGIADPVVELRAGKNYIATQVYSEEEDRRVIELFRGLRVADLADGMDKAGLQNIGLVSPEIKPLWRDTKRFTHRIVGVAVTARYVPTNLPPIGRLDDAEFTQAAGQWYGKHSPEPFAALLRPGSVLVIEDAEGVDVGTIGSNNILGWTARGCVGVVTGGTARDTDEIIAQGVPLYFKQPGRGIRPGRNQLESVNRPVVVGGATVMPGDVIVADGDGVIVVPRRVAEEVANYARGVLEGDKSGRRKRYERLGLPLDESVR